MVSLMAPALPGFRIEAIDFIDNEYILVARAITLTAECPDCAQVSSSVHSWYERIPGDLPSGGLAVRLCLQVRRFFCRNKSCSRKIFCERLPHLLPVYARRTVRLVQTLTLLAFALGGKCGARVVERLGMPTSRDTLLRLIRQYPMPPPAAPRVVGVDDWAFRKGHNYGTIICDLERDRVIDLLPDRESATLADWLTQRPTIEVVARDRSRAYAEGIRAGAPQAMQVVDRWHLLKNLGDALAVCYDHYPHQLRELFLDSVSEPASEPATSSAINESSLPTVTIPTGMAKLRPDQQAREERRAYWLQKFQEVQQLRDQGLSIKAIVRQTGLSRTTVRKYVRLPVLPPKTSPKPGPRLIDPYRTYLRDRLMQEQVPSRQLWREIQAQGFSGGHSTVYHCVAQLRQKLGLPSPKRSSSAAATPKPTPLTSRSLAALVLRRPEKLSERQRNLIEQVCQLSSPVQQATQLARAFATLLRRRQVEQLDAWLQAVVASQLPGLTGFVSGLQQDDDAVKAALTLPWSTGPVEGHVNRLKMMKRQMYGRANFDLLRHRVLYQV